MTMDAPCLHGCRQRHIQIRPVKQEPPHQPQAKASQMQQTCFARMACGLMAGGAVHSNGITIFLKIDEKSLLSESYSFAIIMYYYKTQRHLVINAEMNEEDRHETIIIAVNGCGRIDVFYYCHGAA